MDLKMWWNAFWRIPEQMSTLLTERYAHTFRLHALFSFVLQLGYSAFHHAAVRGDALTVHRLLGDPRVDVNLRSNEVIPEFTATCR